MNKGSLFALLLCGALLTTGCASKKQLETLRNENTALRQANEEGRIQLAECNAN